MPDLRVKHSEGVLQGLLGVGTVHFLSEGVEEVSEVELTGRFSDHLIDDLGFGLTSSLLPNASKIRSTEVTITVKIHHLKGLFELLDLGLVEESKHIRGSLGSLLSFRLGSIAGLLGGCVFLLLLLGLLLLLLIFTHFDRVRSYPKRK